VLGTSAGGPAAGRGIHIVDVGTLRELGTIHVPVAVEALAWLSPRRIAGALQGDVFVADPVLGRLVVKRRAASGVGCDIHPPSAVARHALVLLLGHSVFTVGSDKRVRHARLHGAPDNCSGGAVVVDRRRGRAFTVGAGRSIGEVGLRAMRVRARALAGPSAGGDSAAAIWLGQRGLIAAAHLSGSSGRPAGVELIDTHAWRRHVLDSRAGGVSKAGHTLLVFDGGFAIRALGRRGIGLRAFGLSGRPHWRLLRGQRIWNVQVAGRYAYALGTAGVTVVDLRSHKVVSRTRSAPDEIEFLSPPR
jgi:hypothetical protein